MKTRLLVLLPLVLSGSLFAYPDGQAQGVPQEKQTAANEKQILRSARDDNQGKSTHEQSTQVQSMQAPAVEKLGTVSFPTSCAASQHATITHESRCYLRPDDGLRRLAEELPVALGAMRIHEFNGVKAVGDLGRKQVAMLKSDVAG